MSHPCKRVNLTVDIYPGDMRLSLSSLDERKNKGLFSVCLHLQWLLLFPSFPRNSSQTNEIHTGTNIPNTDPDQFHGKLATKKHNALKLIP